MTTVEIWERDLITPGPPTKVADITEAWGRSFRVAKNDYGSCTINVQLSDPEQGELLPGRLLRFVRDGESYGFLLGPRRIASVKQGEEAGQVVQIQARGMLAVGNDGVCQPLMGAGWLPWGMERRWDYTNPLLDVSGWTAAVELWQQGVPGDPSLTGSDVYSITWDQGRFPYNVPDGFVDGSAWWIHSSGYIGSPGTNGTGTLRMPVGISYYHETFTVAEELRARILAAGDDRIEVAVDGVVQFATGPAPEQGFARARTKDLLLSPGEHTIRVRVENFTTLIPEGNISGPVLAIHKVNGDTDAEGDVLVHTDGSWLALDLPAEPPGFTAGHIASAHLYQIAVQGFLTDVVPTWTLTEDSDGTPWPVVSDVVTRMGMGFGEVLLELAKSHIDFRWNADMSVDMWVKGSHGTATAVEYEQGVNIGELEFDGDSAPVSSLLVVSADGPPRIIGDATAGRQEFVDLSSLPEAQALEQAAVLLADMADQRWSVAINVVPSTGDVPFDDLNVLDTATVPNPSGGTSVVECVAITWAEDEAGNEVLTPELGDVVLTVEERRRLLLRRETAGSLGGRVALPPSAGGGGVSAPAGPGGGGFQPVAQPYAAPPFERYADAVATESEEWPIARSGNLFEVAIKLPAQGSDVDVDIIIDGSTAATITVPAGATMWTQGGLALPVTKDLTQLAFGCADTGFYLQVTARIS